MSSTPRMPRGRRLVGALAAGAVLVSLGGCQGAFDLPLPGGAAQHGDVIRVTAEFADVVLPAANAYEKAGTFTNTCGDIQILKKAGDVTGTKPDFEIIVRIAERMGFDVRRLVPFGRGTHADMGQSRGAQSGEADRHAVWLEAHGLEPKMNPFDPVAVLDEIQRLVPEYDVSRANLMAGNDQHTTLPQSGPGDLPGHGDLIAPANDNLFTSGTLGRYSRALNSVIENPRRTPADQEVAAD